jgi:hypothetical protein
VRSDIEDWKIRETENIIADNKLTKAELAMLKLDVNQSACYLRAELDFLESHFATSSLTSTA